MNESLLSFLLNAIGASSALYFTPPLPPQSPPPTKKQRGAPTNQRQQRHSGPTVPFRCFTAKAVRLTDVRDNYNVRRTGSIYIEQKQAQHQQLRVESRVVRRVVCVCVYVCVDLSLPCQMTLTGSTWLKGLDLPPLQLRVVVVVAAAVVWCVVFVFFLWYCCWFV